MSRSRVIAVVSNHDDAKGLPEGIAILADRYLEGGEALAEPGAVVVNLCRSWKYGGKGYYVSLLADARGQHAIPTVDVSEGFADAYGLFRTLQEAGVPTVDPGEMRARRRGAKPSPLADEEEDDAPRAFPVPLVRVQEKEGWTVRPATDSEAAETLVYLGSAADARFRNTALAVYREWPAPVLRLQLVREDGEWKVTALAPVPPHRLAREEHAALCEALGNEKRIVRRGTEAPREERRASLAVLHDPDDVFSPSSPETLDRLERVAARRNVHVRRIGLDELHKLPEYDALWIRALTGVSEPAFQFALRAEALGMPVVDDSQSIIRCGNKVFLEELLRREGIPTPRTRILTRHTPWEQVAELGSPLVIKLPDGSFSAAVHKVSSRDEFRRRADDMFRRSPLIIAQEFLPTDYDWRITVLDGRLLFACKYHMARGHWQVRTENAAGKERYGRVEAVPRDQAPRGVVDAALRAAGLIGDGLYGVDLKETADGPVVIEINDNPNLDVGYDDAADGTTIYEDLVDFFVRRIEQGVPETPVEAAAAPEAEGELLERVRKPIAARGSARGGERHYKPFEVAGMELEYPTVDRDLNVVSLVEPAFRVLAGRGTSDVDLGAVGFSNEIADHVFEVKTQEPVRSLAEAEAALAEGIQRFSAVLHAEFGGRLLPTGMHPWFDPRKGKLWTRSGLRIYTTYARLFDVRTHGWMNVHAAHLNLPMGREVDAVAMHTAAALLIPYLPALAASTPMYDGELQPAADGRLAWILEHQARIPESCGELVPEYVDGFGDYRKRILAPMYRALDRLPDTGAIRHEFFNTRGAILRFARRAMEIRVLDTQECVKMDVAVAVFVRSALKQLTQRVAAGRVELPDHAVLVDDFRACIAAGSAARVRAPHLDVERDGDGTASVKDVLRHLLSCARRCVRKDEAGYLDLAARMVETGTLSERIRAALAPVASADDETFTEAARRIYIELIDCLEANEPWARRGL